jgi:hypothetical protein
MDNDSPESEDITGQEPSPPNFPNAEAVFDDDMGWILDDEMQLPEIREAKIEAARKYELKIAMNIWKITMLIALASLVIWVCFVGKF